jgi:ATP-dependent protease ClpP protease subunit
MLNQISWGRRFANGEEPVADGAGADDYRIPKLTVETINNHVYFYADVNEDRCLALIRTLRELDDRLRNEHSSRSLPKEYPPTPIWLHIQSPGGGVFAGLGIADQLKGIGSPIFSIVEGYSASAATLISMSCTRRYITPSSFMLIHQLSSFAWGKFEELKDEMHLLNMMMDRLIAFYTERSNLEEERVRELLQRDSWFHAEECVELGLVDEILAAP